TTILALNSMFDIGAAYRLDEGISGLFIFKVSPNFQLGYAYEASFENSVRNLDNGTHEVMMIFKL
ncbi:MAG: type IX secretion system membrane protein PorP/SprF, partial [Cellulophaga sp.]